MKSIEERLRSYEPLWENWKYTGEFLGEGGMSSVFEIASDAFGVREVSALKIITVMDVKNGKVNIPKNALNEINILRSLSDCPNIVHYYDSTVREIYDDSGAVIGADVLIRMEKLKALTESSRFSEPQILKLATDMCHALSSAAKKDVIHRDIKPQNIFIDNDELFKLGDFGVAKIVSEASVHYTKDIGTLAYAAPELCSDGGALEYDASTDIYSLGLVLYAFLNDGNLPFTDSGLDIRQAVLKRIRGSKFPSPKNGSKKLKTIVMRALEFDPKRRYHTAEEMLEDIVMLSDDGKKKYIIDPYATLDANEDGELIDTIIDMASSYAEGEKSMDLSYADKTPTLSGSPSHKARFIGKFTPAESSMLSSVKPVEKAPAENPDTSAPSRLRGTMGSTAPTEVPASHSISTTPRKETTDSSTKTPSHFFKTPEL